MLNTETILQQNGLDWEVVKKPLMYAGQCTTEANNGLHDTPYYALVRSDNGEVLNSVSKSYTPTQNYTIIETMRNIAKDNDLEIVAALSLHGGRKIVVQMQRYNNITVIGGERTQEYIYAMNSHDGSCSLKFGFMNKVMFCQNQFAWMSKNAFASYRHTKSIQDKVGLLSGMIDFTDHDSKIADLHDFATQNVTKQLIKDTVDYLINTDRLNPHNLQYSDTNKQFSTRLKNQREKLEQCIMLEMYRVGHNKWGLFNGVTQFTTHHKSAPKRTFGQQESILIGACSKMNNKAFEYIKNY